MPAQAGIHARRDGQFGMDAHQPKRPCVYMLASRRDGVLYVGTTSDLAGRVNLHRQEALGGFTKKYKVHALVYFEMHQTMPDAIRREKQIKKWNRAWKVRLIEQMNPEWQDLWIGNGELQAHGTGGQMPQKDWPE